MLLPCDVIRVSLDWPLDWADLETGTKGRTNTIARVKIATITVIKNNEKSIKTKTTMMMMMMIAIEEED